MRYFAAPGVKAFATLLTGLIVARAAMAQSDPVAYIDHVYPATLKLNDVVRIQRGGQPVAPSDKGGMLYTGDQIYLRDSQAVLTVRYLADNSVDGVRHSVDAASNVTPDYTVQPRSLPGLSGGLLTWFKAQMQSANQSGDGVIAASGRAASANGPCYNANGQSDVPVKFGVPVFFAPQSAIASGQRALFVSWQGGAPPFSVRLSSADAGALVAELTGVRDTCAARLPSANLTPGRYRLAIIDATGASEEERNLYVVAARPGMPPALRDASLPDNQRQLYYDTWLSATEGGRWAFEAMQHVAAMDCTWSPAREWLERWGSAPACGQ
jgi:hypothetical protein